MESSLRKYKLGLLVQRLKDMSSVKLVSWQPTKRYTSPSAGDVI